MVDAKGKLAESKEANLRKRKISVGEAVSTPVKNGKGKDEEKK